MYIFSNCERYKCLEKNNFFEFLDTNVLLAMFVNIRLETCL